MPRIQSILVTLATFWSAAAGAQELPAEGDPWLTPATAAPADPAAPAPPATTATADPIRTGLELQGSLGLSDCLGDVCSEDNDLYDSTGPGLGVGASGWFRPIPWVALGAGLHYNFIAVDDQRGIDKNTPLHRPPLTPPS